MVPKTGGALNFNKTLVKWSKERGLAFITGSAVLLVLTIGQGGQRDGYIYHNGIHRESLLAPPTHLTLTDKSQPFSDKQNKTCKCPTTSTHPGKNRSL